MGYAGRYARRTPHRRGWKPIAAIAAGTLAAGGLTLAVALPAQAIGPPSGVSIVVAGTDVPVGQGSFTVSWQPVTNAIAYSVTAYLGSTSQVIASQSVTAPATNAIIGSLTGGQRYEITVAAADGSGYGSASARVSATALTVPAPPQGVTAEYDNTSQTTSVAWTRPSSEGGSPILTYEVLQDGQPVTSVAGSTTTASVSGNITVDRLSVRATNAVGTSAVGSSASVPGAPRSVQATATGSTVNASWLVPLDNGGASITSYQVSLEVGGVVQYQATPSGTSTSLASVANGTYAVVVRARNSAGLGASATGSVTVSAAPTPTPTSSGRVPGAPTGVTAVAGDAQATVTWTAPADSGDFPISTYKVTSSPGGVTCISATTSCVVRDLTNGTAYTFSVEALNGAGFGPASAPSAPVTPQGDPSPSPSPSPSPEPTPTPTPTPSPTPTPADVTMPERVTAVRGQVTRITLDVDGKVRVSSLRMSVRAQGKTVNLDASFTRRPDGNLRASFTARQRPGNYPLILRQIIDGERFVLDRSRLVVARR